MRFLERVVDGCLSHFGDLSEVTFVLPGRRTATFLKKYILEKSPQTQWAPKIISFNEMAEEYTDLEVADSITLRFELFKAYLEVVNDTEEFALFDSWANIILSDYNAIDNYLVDSKAAYDDLRNIKDIEAWSFNLDPLSKDQLDFLEFWSDLGKLHHMFKQNVLAKKIAYPGLIMRQFSDQLETLFTSEKKMNLCFAGFNALSKAEEKIISYFQNKHNTQIYWDVDPFYGQMPDHPAGHFTRKMIAKLGNSETTELESKINNESKNIKLISVPNPLSQSRVIGNLLKERIYNDHTAIVLADESLLLPTLESLPSYIDKVNITMGMSANLSPLFKIYDSLISLHVYASKRKDRQGDHGYYHKDFLVFLQQVRSHNDALISSDDLFKIKKIISDQNQIHVDSSFIQDPSLINAFKGVMFLLEPLSNGVNQLVEILLKLTTSIFNSKNLNVINREMALQFEHMLTKFKEVNLAYGFLTNLSNFHAVFRQISSSEKLSFLGEPLGGIQIMGMLETRAIDFDRVIILGANEGILPSGRKPNSFFPHELKKFYGLPNHNDHESVYAYYFYRLIQHPKEVSIVHGLERDDFGGGGEKSRFISQLQYEKTRGRLKCSLNTENYSANISKSQENHLGIKKTEEIVSHLLNLMSKSGLSPSALEKYLSCPLDYYYRYVLDLREENEMEDEINNAVMGTCIHDALEDLYKPLIGQWLDEEKIKNLKTQSSSILNAQFAKANLTDAIKSGPNHLIYLISEKMIKRVLDFDLKRLQDGHKIKILSLEQEYKAPFTIERNEEKTTIILRGKADRVEVLDDNIHIIDYKSGNVKSGDVQITNEDSLISKTKTLQLAQYMWLFKKCNPEIDKNIISSIISLPKNAEMLLSLNYKSAGNDEEQAIMDLFEMQVKKVVSEILDISVDFEHHEKAIYCGFCEVTAENYF
ncbi:MAG: ATP-dependent helicase/nuclease subunit B [Patiriisocius sp.]|jgi:ATP-dependent helicase/nuclease subunit B